jgi:hypothetical protein
VTLSGSNLSGATINAIPGITITNVNATASAVTATFTIAANAATGPQNVTVTTTGGTSNAQVFTINPATPSLTSINPASGVVGSAGFSVTLNGSNLTGATINAIPGITITNVNATASSVTATFTIAANATTGPQNVTVTTAGGKSNSVTFTINPSNPSAPTLTAITPNSTVTGGAAFGVTLSGTNLTGATINGIPYVTISGVSSTATTVTATFFISHGAVTGPQNVTVTTVGGTSNAVTFTIFTPIRIDAGASTAYTDTSGNIWNADADYSGGTAVSTTDTIAGTPDQPLYRTWRAAPSSGVLTYTFTVPNSTRTVNLGFAEAVATAAGQRVFNVSINGVTVLQNFDIFQVAAANTALTESFPVNVTSGQIVIQFTNVSGPRPAIINAIAIQ